MRPEDLDHDELLELDPEGGVIRFAGQRALLLMQHTGLLDSVNALRGVAMEGHNPVCMMVGLLSKEPGVLPTQSKRYGIRIVEPVLDAMQIEHHLIEAPDDVEKVVPAIEAAYARSMPVVMLRSRKSTSRKPSCTGWSRS